MDRSRSFLLTHAKLPFANTFITVIVLGGIIIAFLFAYAAFGEDTGNPTLKYTSIIFRHGDKTPTSSYNTDPFKEAKWWPEGWGQLTKKGKKQMFKLGQLLHSRYSKFLGPYSSQTVRVDSSDHDRCHQSAAVLLAALFPPQGEQVWNNQLLWQPIPIHSSSLDTDKLIVVKAPCSLYAAEKRRTDKELASKYDSRNLELYNYLTQHTGQNITTLLDVETLFNILEIEKNSGKILPSWTEFVFPNKMEDIAALVLASFTYSPRMKRLKGGPLISDITTNMKLRANGASKKKISLYAAHDVTIVSVRRALGFNDVKFKPDLGAALILELHEVNNEPQVELHYFESYTATTPVRWEIPGCPDPCGFTTFTEVMDLVIPLNWDTECQNTSI